MKTVKAKINGNRITYKSGNKILCWIEETTKELPYHFFTPITKYEGFGSDWETLEAAKEKAEKYVFGLSFGVSNVIYN